MDAPEKIDQPSQLKLELKEHQKKIIARMANIELTGELLINEKCQVINNRIHSDNAYMSVSSNTTFNCKINYAILADMVGAGKTFEIIGLICHNTSVPKHNIQYTVNCPCSLEYIDESPVVNTTLIIIPHSLANQWKNALSLTTLKAYFITGSKFIENLNKIDDYDVIVCTNTMFAKYTTKFINVKYMRAVIDEICSIKITSYNDLSANFIWYVTATPKNIANVNTNHTRNRFIGLPDIIYKNIIFKNDDKYVVESMQIPNANHYAIKCRTPKNIQFLKEYVADDVLDMLNAGNYKDAISKINCDVETNDNIMEIITNKYMNELHNKKKELEYHEAKIVSNQSNKQNIIKKISSEIDKLNKKVDAIKERIDTAKNNTCPICLDEYDDIIPSVLPCCKQLLCMQCIVGLNEKCALCRTDFNINEIIAISNNKIAIENKKNIHLSKIDIVLKIINEKENAKILLFSNHDQTYENMIKKLDEYFINYDKITGSCDTINKKVKEFSDGKIKVLFLNAQSYGSGLNLQMATDIVIFHELSKDLKVQVIGRAQRIGREFPLNIYQLCYDHESTALTEIDVHNSINSNTQYTSNYELFDLTKTENICSFNNHLIGNKNINSEKRQIVIDI